MIDVVRDHSELLLFVVDIRLNVNALRAFHRLIGNTGDVEINVLVIHCKVELIRIIR